MLHEWAIGDKSDAGPDRTRTRSRRRPRNDWCDVESTLPAGANGSFVPEELVGLYPKG